MRFEKEIRHEGLNKYRMITGTDPYVVDQKAEAQLAAWEEMWEKKEAKEQAIQDKEDKKEEAKDLTQEAKDAVAEIENILTHTLSINDAINWDKLKDNAPFNKPCPQKKETPLPQEPRETNYKYKPDLNLLDMIFAARKSKKIFDKKYLFKRDHESWEKSIEQTKAENERLAKEYAEACQKWEKSKLTFILKQQEKNKAIDQRKAAYTEKDPGAIADYCDMVLSNSDYPDAFPQDYDVDYNPNNRILIVDYSLPTIKNMPNLKEVKYNQSKDEFTETYLSESVLNKLYDAALYQIALRTLHELFEADIVDAIDAIVFNGWVHSIDKATGQDCSACVISVQTTKEEFSKINLAAVDPKACFKTLKGVGSSKLHSLTPIAPILQIDRNDKRFVSSYAVADALDETCNLASMPWEDFEHLIRGIFEKEFSTSGGEVKVTRASRDGGVDAIAFDPDPIRGGKIVIQAKRYTNTVGVSAVRDLYGTVVNEGATKGLLVTTADYGPDAYEFAKGKPLTLLNGSNLLHLLEKHGHKAKIDLKEAKMVLAETDK